MIYSTIIADRMWLIYQALDCKCMNLKSLLKVILQGFVFLSIYFDLKVSFLLVLTSLS